MEICNLEKHFYMPNNGGTEELNTTSLLSERLLTLPPPAFSGVWEAGHSGGWFCAGCDNAQLSADLGAKRQCRGATLGDSSERTR